MRVSAKNDAAIPSYRSTEENPNTQVIGSRSIKWTALSRMRSRMAVLLSWT